MSIDPTEHSHRGSRESFIHWLEELDRSFFAHLNAEWSIFDQCLLLTLFQLSPSRPFLPIIEMPFVEIINNVQDPDTVEDATANPDLVIFRLKDEKGIFTTYRSSQDVTAQNSELELCNQSICSCLFCSSSAFCSLCMLRADRLLPLGLPLLLSFVHLSFASFSYLFYSFQSF